MLVLNDRRDDARRRCRQKCFRVSPILTRKGCTKISAFGFDEPRIGIGYRANSLRQVCPIGNPVGRGYPLLKCALVFGISVEIGMHRPRTRAAEAGQAMAHVEYEGFA